LFQLVRVPEPIAKSALIVTDVDDTDVIGPST
jgi:hypothetical protein